MAKDYKSAERASRRRSGGGSLLLGILIGLILGLGIALAVAWYINRGPSPFLGRHSGAKSEAPAAATGALPQGKGEERKSGAAAEVKPRFDFYKILPGNEEPATDQQLREAQRKSAASEREAFFLQAGSFQNASDADNLKARLALLGIEATIQAAPVPDKGLWHRVRVGPYTSVEELTRTRDTLRQNGLETSLIKVRESGSR